MASKTTITSTAAEHSRQQHLRLDAFLHRPCTRTGAPCRSLPSSSHHRCRSLRRLRSAQLPLIMQQQRGDSGAATVDVRAAALDLRSGANGRGRQRRTKKTPARRHYTEATPNDAEQPNGQGPDLHAQMGPAKKGAESSHGAPSLPRVLQPDTETTARPSGVVRSENDVVARMEALLEDQPAAGMQRKGDRVGERAQLLRQLVSLAVQQPAVLSGLLQRRQEDGEGGMLYQLIATVVHGDVPVLAASAAADPAAIDTLNSQLLSLFAIQRQMAAGSDTPAKLTDLLQLFFERMAVVFLEPSVRRACDSGALLNALWIISEAHKGGSRTVHHCLVTGVKELGERGDPAVNSSPKLARVSQAIQDLSDGPPRLADGVSDAQRDLQAVVSGLMSAESTSHGDLYKWRSLKRRAPLTALDRLVSGKARMRVEGGVDAVQLWEHIETNNITAASLTPTGRAQLLWILSRSYPQPWRHRRKPPPWLMRASEALAEPTLWSKSDLDRVSLEWLVKALGSLTSLRPSQDDALTMLGREISDRFTARQAVLAGVPADGVADPSSYIADPRLVLEPKTLIYLVWALGNVAEELPHLLATRGDPTLITLTQQVSGLFLSHPATHTQAASSTPPPPAVAVFPLSSNIASKQLPETPPSPPPHFAYSYASDHYAVEAPPAVFIGRADRTAGRRERAQSAAVGAGGGAGGGGGAVLRLPPSAVVSRPEALGMTVNLGHLNAGDLTACIWAVNRIASIAHSPRSNLGQLPWMQQWNQALLKSFLDRFDDMGPSHIARIASAIAKSGIVIQRPSTAISQSADRRSRDAPVPLAAIYLPMVIERLLVPHPHTHLHSARNKASRDRLSDFRSDHLGQLSQSVARSGIVHSAFYRRVAQEVMRNAEVFSGDVLVRILLGLAKARVVHERLLKVAVGELLRQQHPENRRKLDELDGSALSDLLWSVAQMSRQLLAEQEERAYAAKWASGYGGCGGGPTTPADTSAAVAVRELCAEVFSEVSRRLAAPDHPASLSLSSFPFFSLVNLLIAHGIALQAGAIKMVSAAGDMTLALCASVARECAGRLGDYLRVLRRRRAAARVKQRGNGGGMEAALRVQLMRKERQLSGNLIRRLLWGYRMIFAQLMRADARDPSSLPPASALGLAAAEDDVEMLGNLQQETTPGGTVMTRRRRKEDKFFGPIPVPSPQSLQHEGKPGRVAQLLTASSHRQCASDVSQLLAAVVDVVKAASWTDLRRAMAKRRRDGRRSEGEAGRQQRPKGSGQAHQVAASASRPSLSPSSPPGDRPCLFPQMDGPTGEDNGGPAAGAASSFDTFTPVPKRPPQQQQQKSGGGCLKESKVVASDTTFTHDGGQPSPSLVTDDECCTTTNTHDDISSAGSATGVSGATPPDATLTSPLSLFRLSPQVGSRLVYALASLSAQIGGEATAGADDTSRKVEESNGTANATARSIIDSAFWKLAEAAFSAPCDEGAIGPQEHQLLLSAFAEDGYLYRPLRLLESIGDQLSAPEHIEQLPSTVLASTFLYFGRFGYNHHGLFLALSEELLRDGGARIKELSSTHLSWVLFACAWNAYTNQRLIGAILLEIRRRLKADIVRHGVPVNFAASDLATMAWSAAVLGVYDRELFGVILNLDWSQADPNTARLVFAAHLGFQIEKAGAADDEKESVRVGRGGGLGVGQGDVLASSVGLRRGSLQHCQYHFLNPLQRQYRFQEVHQDLEKTLRSLGLTFVPQYVTPEGITVHFAMPDRKIIIEVESHSHLIRHWDEPHWRRSGAVRFGERLLKRCGWSIIRVPWNTLHEAKASISEKQRYITEKLCDFCMAQIKRPTYH
ncbi:unnamed protein product [Vitrella brassicaformis CCMP3155]|uniref:RAP domain-containing protein n=1 Tax=Vitrella brassicaformis (strain CCMP3155) TaxID=1169540 RepID=A0A0G4FYQ2_VITBC|nr:unnamed protein product [Vitrella brassicaformis CCMP3155]|eukprot:CEM20348.1 unnamed protein product [Vitrella brassicaformis CCMP3155]